MRGGRRLAVRGAIAGHIVGEFPHARIPGDKDRYRTARRTGNVCATRTPWGKWNIGSSRCIWSTALEPLVGSMSAFCNRQIWSQPVGPSGATPVIASSTPAGSGRPALDETAALSPSSWPARAGHPRLVMREQRKTWMAGPSLAMTTGPKPQFLLVPHRPSADPPCMKRMSAGPSRGPPTSV